ncbi:PREDICTED: probable RNA-binding protein EIF1AD isoform X2 [Poecilia mexicana]|uniref:probable RNA-binding protein EIF1AD isoform X2 n=1 Tax=Poecilia mexicana TaxID=48701 RepID=UPI00072ED7EB|nr:PREDICTED: probable RNA-binding protein EIF1AD isoform X2 [Poecilia mexicana]
MQSLTEKMETTSCFGNMGITGGHPILYLNPPQTVDYDHCDYVIVDPIEEGEKVKAEISFILYKDHIQYLQKQQIWPEGFMEEQSSQDKTSSKEEEAEGRDEEEGSDSEDDDSDLFVNTNRCNYQYSESEDEDNTEEEEEDEEEKRTENGS